MSQNIAVLILAAGASSRMGTPKQLLPWEKTTLIGNAIRIATDSNATGVFVILGANFKKISPAIAKEQAVVLKNPNWKDGLGSSIAYGIGHLMEIDKTLDGVLIMLCDQPLISPEYLNLLLSKFNGKEKRIVATDYGNRAGVPAIFDNAYFSELRQLKDDFGAKKILENHKEVLIRVDPKGLELDLDTPEEYKTLREES